MPKIQLDSHIKADQKTVFDLSRNIALHQRSTAKTKETAIAGKTQGLLELGETVTWRIKHFGIYQKLTSKMTDLESPHYFKDEMVKGTF